MNLGLGLACGSFRKPLKCGVLAEVSASHSSVGRLRKFPQAHSSVRGVCGSFRKSLASVRGVCGSFRKLAQVCGAFAEVSASFSQVCGAFAEVSASSLKCAAHLRKFPQACPFFEIWYFLVPISSRLCQIFKNRFPEGGYWEVRSVSGFPQPSRLQK